MVLVLSKQNFYESANHMQQIKFILVYITWFSLHFVDNQTKVIIGTAVAVGTAVAGLAYLYKRNAKETIPTKWVWCEIKFYSSRNWKNEKFQIRFFFYLIASFFLRLFTISNNFRWKQVGEIIDLNCFPIKSCAPVKLPSFECNVLGLEYEGIFDRCFIIAQGQKQLTARTYPKMVLIQPNVVGSELIISAPDRPDFILNLDKLADSKPIRKVELNKFCLLLSFIKS